MLCLDEGQQEKFAVKQSTVPARNAARMRVQDLIRELFVLQDLDKNDLLGERELIKLNEKIAMLHYGPHTDLNEVKSKFGTLFREKLNKDGLPVVFEIYRSYVESVLLELDRDPRAHEMILEQWVAEAESARAAFSIPALRCESDVEFLPYLDLAGEESIETLPPMGLEDATQRGHTGMAGHQGYCAGAESFPAGPDPPDGYMRSQAPARRPPPPPFSTASAASGSFMPSSPPRGPSSPSGGLAPYPGLPDASAASGAMLPQRPIFRPSIGVGTGARLGLGALSVSSSSQASMATVPPREGRRGSGSSSASGSMPLVPTSPPYAPGLRIQVWSNTKGSWVDGVVEEVFSAPCLREGFHVPAGCIKVKSTAGIKWVQPGEVSRTLRRFTGHGSAVEVVLEPPFAEGAPVDVWSDSRQAWLPGSVLEAFACTCTIDGFVVPAGTVKVCSDAGIKWVRQEQAPSVLRKPIFLSCKASGAEYAKGERVRVWSDKRKAWVGGVVREVCIHGAGPSMPPGTLKVVCSSGAHWFKPQDVARYVCKADSAAETGEVEEAGSDSGSPIRMLAPPSASFTIPPIASFRLDSLNSIKQAQDPKARVAEALKDPKKLQRRTGRIWTAFGCNDSGGLAKDSVAGALEALAHEFGVRLELEGRHLAMIYKRFDHVASRTDGRISFTDFQAFSREAIGEVYELL